MIYYYFYIFQVYILLFLLKIIVFNIKTPNNTEYDSDKIVYCLDSWFDLNISLE